MKIRRLLAAMLVLALVSVGLPMSMVSAAPRSTPMVYAVAVGPKQYQIRLDDSLAERVISSVTEPGSINTYSVPAWVNPQGTLVAYLQSYDGQYGNSLEIIDAKGAKQDEVRSLVKDAAWSPDGQRLAYLAAPTGDSAATIWVRKPGQDSAPVANVGDAVRLAGWSEDAGVLYLVRRQPTGGFDAERFTALDLRTGVLTDLIRSDVAGRSFTLGFRLERSSTGATYVSYLRTDSLVATETKESVLEVAALTGTVLHSTMPTTNRLLQWAWAPDLSQVAYVVSNLPSDGPADQSGVWTARADGSQAHRLANENAQYELTGWDAAGLTFHHRLKGIFHLDPSAPRALPAAVRSDPQITPDGMCSIGASCVWNNSAPYVHQVFDTPMTNSAGAPYPNGYALPGWGKNDGGKQDACGPTSSVMVAGKFGRLPAKSTWIPEQTNNGQTVLAHYSDFGTYVPSRFTANGTDFNKWDYDASQNQFGQGAHGWMVEARVGAHWDRLQDFLSRLGAHNVANWGGTNGPGWVQDQIQQGHLIIARVQYPGTRGHITVIKGYDGNKDLYILNDPYGQFSNSSGSISWGHDDGADHKRCIKTMTKMLLFARIS